MFQSRAQGDLGDGELHGILLRLLYIGCDTVKAAGIDIIPVVAEFVLYIKYQEKAKGDANGQPQDIEEAVPLVFFEISYGDEKEIFEHGRCFS
jgi:hypothetical protein